MLAEQQAKADSCCSECILMSCPLTRIDSWLDRSLRAIPRHAHNAIAFCGDVRELKGFPLTVQHTLLSTALRTPPPPPPVQHVLQLLCAQHKSFKCFKVS